MKEIYKNVAEPFLLEKIVERVTLLPQIVEVLKHVHEITEERISGLGLGIAELGVDIKVHTADYIALCDNLRSALGGLLHTLRNATTPEVIAQVSMIEQLINILGDLIRFPNIVQIPRDVERIVEVEKAVVVPTKDRESVQREMAANTLIEKLLGELKRVKNSGVELRLEEDIINSFFVELKGVENMKQKLDQFGSQVISRFKSLGEWD